MRTMTAIWHGEELALEGQCYPFSPLWGRGEGNIENYAIEILLVSD